jgi:sucrose-6-phosphate hydrolase SacC (GH32 family)
MMSLPRAISVEDGELRIDVPPEVRDAESVGLTLCCSPGGEERTTVAWHRDDEVLRLDRTRSSLDPGVGRGVHDAPLALAPGEPLTLTAFLDRSVVEAFGNRRAALTSRIYPTRPDSTGIELFAAGGSAHVRHCRVARRASIS